MNDRVLSVLKKSLTQLLEQGQILSFQKGQDLFYAGHIPYGIFVLHSGKIQFLREDKNCHEKHKCPLSQGEVLGLQPMFDGSPYCCTCRAATACRVTFISKTLLSSILKHD